MRGVGSRAPWRLGLRKRDVGIGGVLSDYFCFLSEIRNKVIGSLGEDGEERLENWGHRRSYASTAKGLLSSCDKKPPGGTRWLPPLAPALCQHSRWEEGGAPPVVSLERKGKLSQKPTSCFLLRSHWSELSHMASPSCKGGWQIRNRILKIG